MAGTLTTHTSPYTNTSGANNHNWALTSITYGPFGASADLGNHDIAVNGNYVLGLIPFEGDIEKISLRQGSAVAGAAADKITLKVAAAGTAPASATAITAAQGLDADNDGNVALGAGCFAANKILDVPITGSNTSLAEGTALVMTVEGGVVSLAGLTIIVTYRKGGYLTNTAGNKNYPAWGNPPTS